MKLLKTLTTAMMLLTAATFAQALDLNGKTAEQQGLAVAQERKNRDLGWSDSQSSVIMTLRNAQGEESIREMRMKSLEVADDGDKGLTIFDKPKDVSGTAFLSFSHIDKADDQWLYLPALKRVKRIASKNKSGPFLGSEFSFEDFSFQEVEKYEYEYIKDESYLGKDCFVIKRIPLDPYSGYTKQLVWIDKEDYLVQKIHHFDSEG